MIAFLFILFFALLFFGVPLFITQLLPVVATLSVFEKNIPAYVISQRMVAGVSPFTLVAIPLFIFAADVMLEGDLSSELIGFVEKIVGHLPGGMVQTLIGACTLFGAVSGSTQAAVAAIGGTMYPSLTKKYPKGFILAAIVNASDVAVLIPPSVIMIVYAIVARVSVGRMFLAGIGPGLLLALAFMIYAWWWAARNKIPVEPRAKFKDILGSLREAIWALLLPVIVIGGIYSGIATPTEAAGASVVYAILVEVLVYKKMKLKDLPRVAYRSGITTALVFILVAGGEALAWLLTITRVPATITHVLLGMNPSPILVLMLVNVVFFVALMLMPPLSAVIVLTPLFLPAAQACGIDPIHLGVLITLNCAIGSATPPFGVDLFTACGLFKVSLDEVIHDVWPFILAGVIVLIILTFLPDIALLLPRLAYK
ncbi:MAG: TRAP transporter large permease [Firmicutes bacterium]|nr:TRAP transporter large permease [Bacillota bacterium]